MKNSHPFFKTIEFFSLRFKSLFITPYYFLQQKNLCLNSPKSTQFSQISSNIENIKLINRCSYSNEKAADVTIFSLKAMNVSGKAKKSWLPLRDAHHCLNNALY